MVAALAAAAPAYAEDEAAAVARASERGRAMYAYDRAAWLGTDDMLAKLREPESKVAGYIVEGPVAEPRLIFFDKAPTPQAVYVARFADGKLAEGKVLGEGDDRTIAPATQRMIAALATARAALAKAADVGPCEPKPFNTIVLPPASPQTPVSVYFLTPQVSNDRIPFGGHFQIDVAADGKAGSIRRFANSCITMPIDPRGAALFITHLRDPAPTEVHVFTSLALRIPVLVGTVKPRVRVWTVAGDRIGAPREVKK
jgi:hypothetical protein